MKYVFNNLPLVTTHNLLDFAMLELKVSHSDHTEQADQGTRIQQTSTNPTTTETDYHSKHPKSPDLTTNTIQNTPKKRGFYNPKRGHFKKSEHQKAALRSPERVRRLMFKESLPGSFCWRAQATGGWGWKSH